MLYSNTAVLCHVTYQRHLQPQSARTIVLPVLQRQPGNSRLHCRHSTGHSNPPVKVEHSINKTRALQGCKPRTHCLNACPQGFYLRAEVRDRGRKRSSCRKHRASVSADTLTFARSGSCDKLSRGMLSNASTRSREPGVQAILHNHVLDVVFLRHCMAIVLRYCAMKFWCHVRVCS